LIEGFDFLIDLGLGSLAARQLLFDRDGKATEQYSDRAIQCAGEPARPLIAQLRD
jgi:hypothetical protein